MQNILVQEIENLQAALKEIRLETSSDEEETKELAPIKTQIGILKECLFQVVERGVKEVE